MSVYRTVRYHSTTVTIYHGVIVILYRKTVTNTGLATPPRHSISVFPPSFSNLTCVRRCIERHEFCLQQRHDAVRPGLCDGATHRADNVRVAPALFFGRIFFGYIGGIGTGPFSAEAPKTHDVAACSGDARVCYNLAAYVAAHRLLQFLFNFSKPCLAGEQAHPKLRVHVLLGHDGRSNIRAVLDLKLFPLKFLLIFTASTVVVFGTLVHKEPALHRAHMRGRAGLEITRSHMQGGSRFRPHSRGPTRASHPRSAWASAAIPSPAFRSASLLFHICRCLCRHCRHYCRRCCCCCCSRRVTKHTTTSTCIARNHGCRRS